MRVRALPARRAVLAGAAALFAAGSRANADEPWPAFGDRTIVLFRHANAPGTGDPRDMRLGECATQRNLDDLGRAQARAIGEAFRARGLRVGRVLASRWCRATETAELAFPGRVEPAPALDSFFGKPELRDATTAEARRVLGAWRGPGILVGVTHQVNIAALTGISPLSAEGIVLENRDGALTPAGRLRVEGAALRFRR